MDTISDIKRAVPIRDFCARVGIELNHKHFACCIFHNEKTPSMCVYPDGFYEWLKQEVSKCSVRSS